MKRRGWYLWCLLYVLDTVKSFYSCAKRV